MTSKYPATGEFLLVLENIHERFLKTSDIDFQNLFSTVDQYRALQGPEASLVVGISHHWRTIRTPHVRKMKKQAVIFTPQHSQLVTDLRLIWKKICNEQKDNFRITAYIFDKMRVYIITARRDFKYRLVWCAHTNTARWESGRLYTLRDQTILLRGFQKGELHLPNRKEIHV